MAIATATAIAAGVGIAANGIKAISAARDKKRAKGELNNYERNELVNAHQNRQISTIGSDLIREESSRTTANLIDASRASGIRGIFGAIPQIQGYNTKQNAHAQKYLDDQFNSRSIDMANDEIRLRQIKENRDIQNIAGLSSQINSANQDIWSGISGIAGGLSSLSGGLGGQGGANPQVKSVGNIQSSGVNLNTTDPLIYSPNLPIYNG